ncbi:MAG: CRISPR-associated endoribonuclease Cas6 [Bacteroidia bacterium]|nr:CRISPR-associated endoribonuclease Cas6 [Bacteroidia bacterium]
MRVKFSFLKSKGSDGSLPLHHQKLISSFISEMLEDFPNHTGIYNFSTLKGTSKVQAGQIRFHSSKVSLAFASLDDKIVEHVVHKIFSLEEVQIGKLGLIPKAHQLIQDPEFSMQMKYVCISPLVVEPADVGEEPRQTPLEPATHEFSDHLFNTMIERMEAAGYSEEDLNSFAEFELQPDKDYIKRMNEQGKKLVRYYKNDNNDMMPGYLIPFTLHAHPKVQKFIWDAGLGLYCNNGFGMIDVVAG